MNIDLTEEQRQVRELCREFAEQELKPNARRWDAEHQFPREAVAKLGEMGLLGVAVPAG
jgi:butyryl-CoA dehydrogenase